MKGAIFGKLIFKIIAECKTGIHIGGAPEVMGIGGVDSPVVRDPVTNKPYIPGSSIKGKLRTLIEKAAFATSSKGLDFFNKKMDKERIRRHECGKDKCSICRLFGASEGNGVEKNYPGLLQICDAQLINENELENIDTGLYLTELKFENTLDRITAAASPRQIERVPRGAKFGLEICYTLDEKPTSNQVKKDIKELLTGLRLLEDDYLGGNGSRGYGRIQYTEFEVILRSMDYYRSEEKDGKNAESKKSAENYIEFKQNVLTLLKNK